MSGYIHIKGARGHNLKNIELKIPYNKLIVITGLSGSGKSTLAFDTLFAEGRRRYVESLSSYARQFLGKIEKPEVDFIDGIPPAIAIEQRVSSNNPRSTVGTSTEIYDYLKMFYARVGEIIAENGDKVVVNNIDNVAQELLTYQEKNRGTIYILSPFNYKGGELVDSLLSVFSDGYTKLLVEDELINTEDILTESELFEGKRLWIVIDRVDSSNLVMNTAVRDSETLDNREQVIAMEDELFARLSEAVSIAYNLSNGYCDIASLDKKKSIKSEKYIIKKQFSASLEYMGVTYATPSVELFSFNNPLGACPKCEGTGKIIGLDENLIIPNPNLSIIDNVVAPWRGITLSQWKDHFINGATKLNFDIYTPYNKLSAKEINLLWNGDKNSGLEGIYDFFTMLENSKHKIQSRVLLSRYMGKTKCNICEGTRLREEAQYVYVGGRNISSLLNVEIGDLLTHFKTIVLNDYQKSAAGRLLIEIENRLEYLQRVGLDYLTLNRQSSTLSGGESQRLVLSTMLGSCLEGALYVLDEPSIGLHSRDTLKLVEVLKRLRDLGNTVIVVEHERDIMMAADEIIDIGPKAGRFGGEVVFNGNWAKLLHKGQGITADYLKGVKKIDYTPNRRETNEYILVEGARENNLKEVSVKFPLKILTVVAGVSGSGKSSLITKILYPALAKQLGEYSGEIGRHDTVTLSSKNIITSVELVDQDSIGKSSRSNAATYLKVYDLIRKIYAETKLSKQMGYTPSNFSFNVQGGRCECCKGEGFISVEMQFMASVNLVCEECNGKRFKDSVLEINYRGKNINDILSLSIEEAITFFLETKETHLIAKKLTALKDVGLDYIQLGQSLSTLSGGEIQRVKLAYYLSKENERNMLFIFDEPTTGLHFHDINKLLTAFDRLIEHGNSVIVVEHNMEVIKRADHLIEIGPEGGDKGGYLIFEGTPEAMVKSKKSVTGEFLKGYLIKS